MLALSCASEYTPCDLKPCLNNGTCTDNVTATAFTFSCACPTGYTGDNCIARKTCCSDSSNSAVSIFCLEADKLAKLHCSFAILQAVCDARPSGLDTCYSNPCLNGGTCALDTLTGAWYCNCTDPYYGVDCSESEYSPHRAFQLSLCAVRTSVSSRQRCGLQNRRSVSLATSTSL